MECPYCGRDNIPGVDLCERCGSDLAGLDLPEAGSGFTGRLMTDRIDDLPLTPPVTIGPGATVAAAVARMQAERHGCVLVLDGEGELVGIFTERDLLTRVLRPGRDAAAVEVAEVMTPRPIVLSPHDPPAFAIHRMVVEGLRHLPVVDGSELKGFVSTRTLLRYIHHDVLTDRA